MIVIPGELPTKLSLMGVSAVIVTRMRMSSIDLALRPYHTVLVDPIKRMGQGQPGTIFSKPYSLVCMSMYGVTAFGKLSQLKCSHTNSAQYPHSRTF